MMAKTNSILQTVGLQPRDANASRRPHGKTHSIPSPRDQEVGMNGTAGAPLKLLLLEWGR